MGKKLSRLLLIYGEYPLNAIGYGATDCVQMRVIVENDR